MKIGLKALLLLALVAWSAASIVCIETGGHAIVARLALH